MSSPRLNRPAAFALAVALLAAPATLATPALADVGTVVGEPTAALARSGASRIVIPMTLSSGVPAGTVRTTVVSVARDGVQSAEEADAVQVSWDAAVPAIVATVAAAGPTTGLPRAGTYTVSVKLTAGAQSQVVVLTLTRAAATLTAPAHVPVVQERAVLGLPGRTTRPPLTVTVGPDDTLTALTGVQQDAAIGTVTVGPIDVQGVGPGHRTVVVPYDLADFPLGVTNRTIVLDSPQLAEPRTVVFDITVRRSRWLILVLVLAGLAAGVLVRRVVTPLRDRLDANDQAYDLLDDMDALVAESADPDYRAALTKAGEELRRKLRGPAAERTAAIEAARTAVAAAGTDLDGRIAAVVARHTELAALDREWQLPEPLRTGRGAVHEALARAAALIEARDAIGAGAELDLAKLAADRLANEAKDVLAQTDRDANQLLVNIGDRDRGAIGDLRVVAQSLHSSAAVPQDAGEVDVVAAVDRCQQLAGRVVATAVAFEAEAAEVRAVLAEHAPEPVLADLDAAMAELPPEAGLHAVAGAEPRLREAVEAAITAVSAAPAVRDLLATGAYTQAAEQAIHGTPLGAATDAAEPRAESAEPAPVGSAPPAPAALAPTARVRAPLAPRRRQRLATAVGLGWLWVVQFAVLGLILVLVGFELYGSTWIGTTGDIAAVFSWAFAIDVTVGGVTAALAARGGQPA